MYLGIYLTFVSISWATSTPVNILHREQASPMDDVVFIPYDVEYVPIEVSAPLRNEKHPEADLLLVKSTKEDIKPLKLNEKTLKEFEEQDIIYSSKSKLDDKEDVGSKKDSIEASHTPSEERSSNFDLFEDNFNSEATQSSEDFVLVPISVLRNLQASNDEKTHVIEKRQAPGVVPLSRFTRVVTNAQRVGRAPALVAYMNNYDHFPTVA